MGEGTDVAFQRGKSVMGEIQVWGGGRHRDLAGFRVHAGTTVQEVLTPGNENYPTF